MASINKLTPPDLGMASSSLHCWIYAMQAYLDQTIGV